MNIVSQALFSKQNTNSPYKDTDEEKLKLLRVLDEKYKHTITLSDKPAGTKNLIYFAVYGNNYTMLLEYLLCSIYNYSKTNNFDILIITDSNGCELIKSKPIISKLNCYFYIVDTPEDGVAASMTKTLIYNYNRINEYKKILFLDADMICTKDIQGVFDIELNNKLYVVEAFVSRKNIKDRLGYEFFKNAQDNITCLYSTLIIYTPEQEKFIKNNKTGSFSAGHFLFQNSVQMRKHFENLNWLINSWPGLYFFEQSFMNHYFLLYDITNFVDFNSKVDYITFLTGTLNVNSSEKRHADDSILLHFAGQPVYGAGKLEYIRNYCKTHNILIN